MPSMPKISDANQWMNCHGSYKAQIEFPGYTGEVSQSRLEGRACHETTQDMFRRDADAPLFTDIVGSLSKDGIVITQELFDASREYFNEVWGYCNSRGLLQELHIEEPVPVNGQGDEWYGIPDAWVYDSDNKVLKIWDAKFGHRIVNPFEHWPMIIYAVSITEHYRIEPDIIELTVAQPRGYSSEGIVRNWALTYDELESYAEQFLNIVEIVSSDSPDCKIGTWCKTCTARANCTTLQRVVYENIDYVADLVTHELTGHNLGVELKLLKRVEEMLKTRISGLEEQALYELKNGTHIPFFASKTTAGRERWRKDVPIEEVIMMGQLLGEDLRKPVELDTPAQCRKKGIDAAIIAEYSETPVTGVKLIETNEKNIREVFK